MRRLLASEKGCVSATLHSAKITRANSWQNRNLDMKLENSIEEIWRIRDELGAEEGYDVHQLFARLRREEKKYADRLVRVVPKRGPEESTAVLHEDLPKAK